MRKVLYDLKILRISFKVIGVATKHMFENYK